MTHILSFNYLFENIGQIGSLGIEFRCDFFLFFLKKRRQESDEGERRPRYDSNAPIGQEDS